MQLLKAQNMELSTSNSNVSDLSNIAMNRNYSIIELLFHFLIITSNSRGQKKLAIDVFAWMSLHELPAD